MDREKSPAISFPPGEPVNGQVRTTLLSRHTLPFAAIYLRRIARSFAIGSDSRIYLRIKWRLVRRRPGVEQPALPLETPVDA